MSFAVKWQCKRCNAENTYHRFDQLANRRAVKHFHQVWAECSACGVEHILVVLVAQTGWIPKEDGRTEEGSP